MNAAKDFALFVDDLAGCWTDRTLEILTAAGIRQVSVDMEVAIWHSLKRVLGSVLAA